jgi:hypothetical protein
MSKITGKEILGRDLATLKEILQLMKQGLPATTPTGEHVYNINNITTDPSKDGILEFPDRYHGISMEIPTTPAEQAQAMNTVMPLVFSEDDFVNARYWGKSMDQFPGLNTDMLMKAAGKWARHIQNEYAVKISGITLYGFQSSFASDQNLSEKPQNEDGTEHISSLKYAIVFFIDCPGEAQNSGEWFACPHQHISSFISGHQSHIKPGFMGIPDFAMTGIQAAYSGEVPDNYKDEWVILPACTGPGCNGIEIPEGVRKDEPNLILYWKAPPKKIHEQETLERESFELRKCWVLKNPKTKMPIKEIKRLPPKKEIGVWNRWIKPIVDQHYKGNVTYKFVSGDEKISLDDFRVLWEQYLVPVICSNFPEWLEYPQSMSTIEIESRISENIWEPDFFILQVLWKIRAGMWPEVVEPFFNCLTNIVAGKDLPTFLAYIAQGEMEGVEVAHEKPMGQSTEVLPSPDALIKTITIRYENDSQITIQQEGKQKIPIPLEQLGFRNSKEKVVWKNFLAVLQEPPYYYWQCPEERYRKRIATINKRLIEWLINNTGLIFPPKYKLYERVKSEAPGTYCFKFKIEYSDTIQVDQSAKETFREKFFSLLEQYKKTHANALEENLVEMAKNGLIKGYLTETEINDALGDKKSTIQTESEFLNEGYSIKQK